MSEETSLLPAPIPAVYRSDFSVFENIMTKATAVPCVVVDRFMTDEEVQGQFIAKMQSEKIVLRKFLSFSLVRILSALIIIPMVVVSYYHHLWKNRVRVNGYIRRNAKLGSSFKQWVKIIASREIVHGLGESRFSCCLKEYLYWISRDEIERVETLAENQREEVQLEIGRWKAVCDTVFGFLEKSEGPFTGNSIHAACEQALVEACGEVLIIMHRHGKMRAIAFAEAAIPRKRIDDLIAFCDTFQVSLSKLMILPCGQKKLRPLSVVITMRKLRSFLGSWRSAENRKRLPSPKATYIVTWLTGGDFLFA